MSLTDDLPVCKKLVVEKQLRCAFTGSGDGFCGRSAVLCADSSAQWAFCRNGPDVSILSLGSGEVIMSVSGSGSVLQRAAPMSRVVGSESDTDAVIAFATTKDDSVLAVATGQFMIRLLDVQFHTVSVPLAENEDDSDAMDTDSHSDEELKSDSESTKTGHKTKMVTLPCGVSLRKEWTYAEMKAPITCMTFDRETGHSLVAATGNGQIRVWNALTGNTTHKFSAHTFPVTCLWWHPDPSQWTLYSGSADCSTRVWRLKKDRLVLLGQSTRLQTHVSRAKRELHRLQTDDRSEKTSVLKSEKKLASLTQQFERSLAVERRYAKQCLSGVHHSAVTEVIVCKLPVPSEWQTEGGPKHMEVVVTAAIDDVFALWNARTFELLAVLAQPSAVTSMVGLGLSNALLYTDEKGALHAAEFVLCGHSPVAVSSMRAPKASHSPWALRSKATLQLAATAIGNVTLSPRIESRKDLMAALRPAGGQLLAEFKCCVTSTDLNLYAVAASMQSAGGCRLRATKTVIGNNDDILDIAYFEAKGKQMLALATNSSELRIVDLESFGAQLLAGHCDTVMAVAVHRQSGVVGSASKDNCVRFWKQLRGRWQCVALGTGHSESVNALAASNKPDTCWFVSGSRDGSCRVWHLPSELLQHFDDDSQQLTLPMPLRSVQATTSHQKEVMAVAISPNDAMAVSASTCGRLVLYKCNTAASGHWEDDVMDEALRDSKLRAFGLRSAGGQSAAGKWLTQAAEHKYHRGRALWSAVFSPTERVLATAHNNGELKLWSLPALTCVSTLADSSASALSVAFLDGGALVSAHSDGFLKLWQADGQCLARFRQHYDRIWALTCGGGRVLSGGSDAVLNVWKDDSQRMEEESEKRKLQIAAERTEVCNLVLRRQYAAAVRLCLTRDTPRQLLAVFKQMEAEAQSGAEFVARLRPVVAALCSEEHSGPQLVGRLLSLTVDWNTFAGNCLTSQCLLRALFLTVDAKDLLSIPPSFVLRRGKGLEKDGAVLNLAIAETAPSRRSQHVASILSALKAYSRRQRKRLDEAAADCCLIEYMLQSLAPTTASLPKQSAPQTAERSLADDLLPIHSRQQLAELCGEGVVSDKCKPKAKRKTKSRKKKDKTTGKPPKKKVRH